MKRKGRTCGRVILSLSLRILLLVSVVVLVRHGRRRESVIDRGYDRMQGMRTYKFPHCASEHAESWRLGLCSRIVSHSPPSPPWISCVALYKDLTCMVTTTFLNCEAFRGIVLDVPAGAETGSCITSIIHHDNTFPRGEATLIG